MSEEDNRTTFPEIFWMFLKWIYWSVRARGFLPFIPAWRIELWVFLMDNWNDKGWPVRWLADAVLPEYKNTYTDGDPDWPYRSRDSWR